MLFIVHPPPLENDGATPLTKNGDVFNDLPPHLVEKIKNSELMFTRYIPSKNNFRIREINRVFKLRFKTKADMISPMEKVFDTENQEDIQDFLAFFSG